MGNFFNLTNVNGSYEISLLEKFAPILLVLISIVIVYINQNKIRNSLKLDKYLRYSIGILSGLSLSLYYLILWSAEGITAFNLPLHICFVSNILCIVLCFNKSKLIYNFVIYTGVLGGISSLFAPVLDLSYKYFRYYQFMICHCSIVIIPIYFLIVYKYNVNFKDTIKQILLIELLGVSLGIFNELYDTTYMFVSFTSNRAARDSILYYIGTGTNYFINLQLLFLISISIYFFLLRFIFKKLKI